MTRYLHEAVRKAQRDLVTSLLSQPDGIDINARDGYGMTALMWAAGRGYQDIVETLLKHGPGLEEGNELVSVKSIEKLEGGKGDFWELNDRMGMLFAKKHYGWTALTWAARNGQTEVANLLLDGGANINAITKDGFTALVHAIDNKHAETAQLLLKRGANASLAADSCSPALPMAARHGFVDLVQAILDQGGSLNALDHFGHSALSNAVGGNHADALALLLKHGADVNVIYPEDSEVPLLHIAAVQDSLECARVLLDHGADINAKDARNSATALEWASDELSGPRVARLLIERGADARGALGTIRYFRASASDDELAEADEIIALIESSIVNNARS